MIVYFIVGIIFSKFFQQKNGFEMIPNYQFWSSLPGDVRVNYLKIGIKFFFKYLQI